MARGATNERLELNPADLRDIANSPLPFGGHRRKSRFDELVALDPEGLGPIPLYRFVDLSGPDRGDEFAFRHQEIVGVGDQPVLRGRDELVTAFLGHHSTIPGSKQIARNFDLLDILLFVSALEMHRLSYAPGRSGVDHASPL